MTVRLLLPSLLLLATAASAAPVDRLPIVDRAIEHHGGDVYSASETSLELCSRSGCYPVTARVDGGRYFYRVEGDVRAGSRVVESSNDGLRAWLDGAEQTIAPDEEQPLRDWAMARVYFCFLPFRLNDPSVQKVDLGTEIWEGRELAKVKVTFAAGTSTDDDDEYLYWFDVESGRLAQFAYSYSGDPGGLRFRRLHNYRRVGGILFFDQHNLGVEGDGLKVDDITPDTVEEMRVVSEVRLSKISVEPLETDATGR